MPLPLLPPKALEQSRFADQAFQFPANILTNIPIESQKQICQWMLENYLFPQILERRDFEPQWDHLYKMYRVKLKQNKKAMKMTDKDHGVDGEIEYEDEKKKSEVSDTLIYDAVDRLANLNHFISWKDGTPIKFSIPKNYSTKREDEFYHPLADKIASANGLLEWNIGNQDVYRKHLILSRHHYLYGIGFVRSEFEFQLETLQHRRNDGTAAPREEITKIGTTFEPVSLRRIWLNYRIPAYNMEFQPCPFFIEETPLFAILQNQYDPRSNPFGFINLELAQANQSLFSSSEMESVRNGFVAGTRPEFSASLTELTKPEHSLQGLWTFYPMLPLSDDGKTFDPKGQKYQRFIVQMFSNNLISGDMVMLRIQKNFYPRNSIPLYGTSHMPDLDSGTYTPSIGDVLHNHYNEICKATNQFLDNKDWINNPPSWHVMGSPAATANTNEPGAKIPVTGANDFGWRTPFDATATTIEFLRYTRDVAQTSSKAVDAILGKAMGSRTSATEASNAFQSAMSGVTTDINLFNFDAMGNFADRVWNYSGAWFDPDLLKFITGQYGTPLTLEDMWLRVALVWDVGSNFIESIVKQQHYRYALEAGVRSPALRQDILWKAFFQELRLHEAIPAVIDGGFEKEVALSQEQAIKTYLGMPFVLSPDQDHQIALQVKTRFLEDVDSTWNREYGPQPSASMPGLSRAQELAQQIAIHQQFALLQMQQQMAQQQAAMAAQQLDGMTQGQGGQGTPSLSSGSTATTAGAIAQQNANANGR